MPLTIRDAVTADAPVILGFIIDLATYENAADAVEATVDSLTDTLFGPKPAAVRLSPRRTESLWALPSSSTAIPPGRPARVFTLKISMWRPKRAARARARHCCATSPASHSPKAAGVRMVGARLEHTAIRVYDAIGAKPQSEWIRYRLAGDDLTAFADGDAMKVGDQDA